jgi:hypothetical protein
MRLRLLIYGFASLALLLFHSPIHAVTTLISELRER